MRPYPASVLLLALVCGLSGCGPKATPPAKPPPIAAGTLENVTIWTKPVQRPGETGENTGSSPEKGSRVEVYENFIIVTSKDGSSILSLHGWYTDLRFKKD
ncbi:MAG: hypothetical protein JO112_09910 [Planctomycetes bacterium]|nr:hypothetical protein [Planctomycetota bacterium]